MEGRKRRAISGLDNVHPRDNLNGRGQLNIASKRLAVQGSSHSDVHGVHALACAPRDDDGWSNLFAHGLLADLGTGPESRDILDEFLGQVSLNEGGGWQARELLVCFFLTVTF